MTGNISYDLLMDDDMSFIEGTFRVEGGDWQVFVFLNKRPNNKTEPQWQLSTWGSGVTGLVFDVPWDLRLNKESVMQMLSVATGVHQWNEVTGPDSMNLR